MRKRYPSDISREHFEAVLPLLESSKKKTSPCRVDLYDIFCAMTYLLKSGCQWRMLPSDFPNWSTVYFYYRQWSASSNGSPSLLEQALKKCGWRGPYKIGAQGQDEFLRAT